MRLHCHELSAATASSAPLVDGAWHLVRGQGPRLLSLPAEWPSLWQVERGCVALRTMDAQWTLRAGSAQLWRGAPLQAQPSHEAHWRCLAAPLPQWCDRFADNHDDTEPLPWREDATAPLLHAFADLATRPSPAALDALVNELRVAQRGLEEHLPRCRGRTLRHRRQTLLRLLNLRHLMQCHVEADDDAGIDVAWLADRAHYSSGHLIRLHRDVFGETPGEALARLRHERAWRLVRETDMPVGAITHKLGFESQSAFCRSFKHAFGMTATEARRRETDECTA